MIVAVYIAILISIIWLIAKFVDWIVEMFEKKKKGYPVYTGNTSKKLVFQILKDLNCTYQIEQERIIQFNYQNRIFEIDPFNDNFIEIYTDLVFLDLDNSKEDIQNLKILVNNLNINHYFTSFFYQKHEEDNRIVVFGRISTLFVKEIPNVKQFFCTLLDMFFEAERNVKDMYSSLEQEKEQKNRIVVKGFTPIEENEDK